MQSLKLIRYYFFIEGDGSQENERSLEEWQRTDSLSDGSIEDSKDINFRPNGYLLRKIDFMNE